MVLAGTRSRSTKPRQPADMAGPTTRLVPPYSFRSGHGRSHDEEVMEIAEAWWRSCAISGTSTTSGNGKIDDAYNVNRVLRDLKVPG